ncbi:hypothetical protein MPTK1_7g01640 [Marchantia polymorpha subsp. ruderalis]|uniref:Uncharacterized protein n=2 Tax=Marchantia polymorpha TaxID=3197 RepID=A0AAF6BV39_MARPO|nr:hypothetical protein MARPO_0099s0037 [Marchantia polymorpha]BBN15873.1 hypothetical protein Mp_7g01640 [Marchantia polymorpha subsp. ruderalis]|eukprot:PTQ32401.1 hypothetical protein MARPO_0099s0037 [Marchantia polymorpha]
METTCTLRRILRGSQGDTKMIMCGLDKESLLWRGGERRGEGRVNAKSAGVKFEGRRASKEDNCTNRSLAGYCLFRAAPSSTSGSQSAQACLLAACP